MATDGREPLQITQCRRDPQPQVRYNDREMAAVLEDLDADVDGFCEEVCAGQGNDCDRVNPASTALRGGWCGQAMHEAEHHLHDVRHILAARDDLA